MSAFDMDSTIEMIDSHFGDMGRKSLGFDPSKEDPIAKLELKKHLVQMLNYGYKPFRDNKSGDEKHTLVSKILYTDSWIN